MSPFTPDIPDPELLVELDPDREYPLPLKEMEAAIEAGQFIVRLNLSGDLVIRDSRGRMVRGTAGNRQIGDVKSEMRAAILNYMDEGGMRKVVAAMDRHLGREYPQWQVIKMALEYSVGPATDKAADSANQFAERLHELLKPQPATVIELTSTPSSDD